MDDRCEYILSSADNLLRSMQRALTPQQIGSNAVNSNINFNLFVFIGLILAFFALTFTQNNLRRQQLSQDKIQRNEFQDSDRNDPSTS